MSTDLATQPKGVLEKVVINGDLAALSEADRVSYYGAICESLGLNPLTQPFAYIKLNNKLTLYALKSCTDQLRKIHHVSVTDISAKESNGLYVVTCQVRDKEGRTDASTGAVFIGGLKGDSLANAIMKAESKSKRRATLSICGLALLDETEAETIPGAQTASVNVSGDIPQGEPPKDERPKSRVPPTWFTAIQQKKTLDELDGCKRKFLASYNWTAEEIAEFNAACQDQLESFNQGGVEGVQHHGDAFEGDDK